MKYLLLVCITTLFSTGCSIFSPGDSDVTISLHSEQQLNQPMLLTVTIARREYEVSLAAGRQQASLERDVGWSGMVPVTARLQLPTLAASAEVSFNQRFEESARHWVAGWVGRQRPVGLCIGQLIAVPISPALGTSGPDSLFITFGSLPKDAVC